MIAELRRMERDRFRAEVLASCGADAERIEELLRYNQNVFERPVAIPRFPLADEPFVAAWEEYARESESEGGFACLRRRFVQMRFPIAEGISQSEEYRRATRRGFSPTDGAGLSLRKPARLRIAVHPTAAGRIGLIITGDRADFVSLVRAFSMKNEPITVPDSMGACMIAGFNNWDRIARLRAQWESDRLAATDADWQAEFERIILRKELYQDRFIILSDGPYSGVAAVELGLQESEWRRLSLAIRRDHECTHYFTRRVLHSMRSNLIDELIADYIGIVAATGSFRADWFLRFLGLEEFPEYRETGRLSNYRGDPPLSDEAFVILQKLVHAAAGRLESFSQAAGLRATHYDQGRMLLVLSTLTLEELASEAAAELLRRGFAALNDQSNLERNP